MSDAPDRLSPELEAFLAPERRRPDPPADVQSEVLSRVGATLGWSGGPGPGGAPPGGDIGGGIGGGSAGAHAAGAVAKGALAKTVVTLVVGGVIGAGVHEVYDRTTDRRGEHASVAVVAPPAPPALPLPAPAPPPAAPAVAPQPEPAAPRAVRAENPPARAEHAAKTEARERDRNLGAERGLIEQARTALAREQGAAALAVLDRHARDFPQGELEEERESLRVQALVGLGQSDQARKTGARFHRRFPRSIFGAVVDEALKSIP
jgi:pyruvate/2-oxoglutarate dehydrogenase complex dihydrolipoamide acyltransferase (E2) component